MPVGLSVKEISIWMRLSKDAPYLCEYTSSSLRIDLTEQKAEGPYPFSFCWDVMVFYPQTLRDSYPQDLGFWTYTPSPFQVHMAGELDSGVIPSAPMYKNYTNGFSGSVACREQDFLNSMWANSWNKISYPHVQTVPQGSLPNVAIIIPMYTKENNVQRTKV